MTRQLRIQYDGAWYHVMNRGAERKPIFKNDHHRLLFLDLLAEIVEAHKIEIHAYCLMTNHYHLLIHTPFGNLSDAMRQLGCVYTIKYNQSLNIDGSLFRGRYKSKLVQDEHYSLHLVRYIHLNPLNAGMADNLEDYQWSSYRAYLGLISIPPWLSVEHTVRQFDKSNFIDDFRHFTLTDTSVDIDQFFSSAKSSTIIGNDEFVERIKSTVNYEELSCEFSERIFFKPSIVEIIFAVAKVFHVSVSSINSSLRGLNVPRSCTFFIARKHFAYKLIEICDQVGIQCYQTVSRAVYQFEAIIQQNDHIHAMYLDAVAVLNLLMSNNPSEKSIANITKSTN